MRLVDAYITVLAWSWDISKVIHSPCVVVLVKNCQINQFLLVQHTKYMYFIYALLQEQNICNTFKSNLLDTFSSTRKMTQIVWWQLSYFIIAFLLSRRYLLVLLLRVMYSALYCTCDVICESWFESSFFTLSFAEEIIQKKKTKKAKAAKMRNSLLRSRS